MIDDWLRSIETVLLSGPVAGARVLGFVSPDAGAGVSTIASTVAEIAARSGDRVLLYDLSRPFASEPAPSPFSAREAVSGGFDRVVAETDRDAALRFNNAVWLRGIFVEGEAAYDRVVVDLPPLSTLQRDRLNPLAAAAACDAVVLVCARGRSTPAAVEAASTMLRGARVRLVGSILNDRPARPRSARA